MKNIEERKYERNIPSTVFQKQMFVDAELNEVENLIKR